MTPALLTRAHGRLIHIKPLRQAVQVSSVARSVSPTGRFVLCTLDADGCGRFRHRSSGMSVWLRPRRDLQVAREHLAKDGYVAPPAATATLAAVDEPLRIADLGANIGLFTLAALRRHGPHSTVIAVEPDSANASLLRRNISENGVTGRVHVLEAAATTSDGVLSFCSGRGELARAARPGDATSDTISVPAIDVLPRLAECHLLKMDIEGGEWEILRDPRLADCAIRAIALEWHTKGTDIVDGSATAERLLTDAGFSVAHEPTGVAHVGGLWAWRSR